MATFTSAIPACRDYILDDVAKIDIYRDADCQTAVPRTLPSVLSIADMKLGTPLLTLGMGDAYDAEYDTAPTLKVTSKNEQNGRIFTVDLQVAVVSDLYNVREAERKLVAQDCAVVFTDMDGRRTIALPLPNTSSLSIDESVGSSASSTLKVQLSSLSPLVSLDV